MENKGNPNKEDEEIENKESSSEEENLKLQIKFGGQTIRLNTSSYNTVADLKFLLLSHTNVLPRGQKLIFKGKVLNDSDTLGACDLCNGSKIMLIASQGLHQGEGPLQKNSPAIYQRTQVEEHIQIYSYRRSLVTKTRGERWKATGVIGLSESRLKAIPEAVWEWGSFARVLDLSNNCIHDIPAKIGCLKYIQKLVLNSNGLLDDSISWQGLTEMKGLTYLSLDQNQLTTLPSSLGALTYLEQLHVASNKLASLPSEIGLLTRLEILKVNNNRLTAIPPSLGDCSSLIEVDMSSNLLAELPETFGNLKILKALHLNNNGLKSLPSNLFKKCVQLSTLDLHGTIITIDILRQVEGWEDFDRRRCSKLKKQLEFHAGGSAEFDEGADRK
ncbi:hypothetical protein BVRB_7g175350 [Beta vulgaris subsp. vulgaris]|nr:hypothetical protein BVRB_7g175350 [Beta vulgaris subsp. vulgaris]